MSITNQAIVDRMKNTLAGQQQNAAPSLAPCTGFTFGDFAVTYPNDELMVNAVVTGVPNGITLFGVTVAAMPATTPSETSCMAVASNVSGLTLPVSLLGATTLPSFPAPTSVTGMIILSFGKDGSSQQECVVQKNFTVGG
jgi:hypothetical protein